MADPGEGPGGAGSPTLFLDQNEARRTEKKNWGDQAPPFSKSLDDRASLLSQGLDPALKTLKKKLKWFLMSITLTWSTESSAYLTILARSLSLIAKSLINKLKR